MMRFVFTLLMSIGTGVLPVWIKRFAFLPIILASVLASRADDGTENTLAPLNHYIQTALENNADLKAAHTSWKAAMEKVPQARSLPDPRFTYGYFVQPIETRTGPQRQRFGIGQTLPWFGKLSLKEKQASLEAEAQLAKLEGLRLKVIRQVKDAYYEYAYVGQAIAITRENIELVGYLERVAEARYTTGLSPYAQTVRLQVELGKLENRLRSLEDLRVPLQARLNSAMSRPQDEGIAMPAEVPLMIADMTDAEIMAGITESNPDLRAIEILAKAAETGIELAERDYYPDFTFGLEMIQQDDARQGDPKNNGDYPVIATVSINLPIWFDSRRAKVREAVNRKKSFEEKIVGTRDSLCAAMQLALYKYRDAGRKIDLFRNNLLPKAEQAFGATLEAFQTGSQSALDLIDVERTLLEFQLSYLRALADQGQRMADMEEILGREIPCKIHSVTLRTQDFSIKNERSSP
jgi:outer membrane protein TolC